MMSVLLLSGMACNKRLWAELLRHSPMLAKQSHYIDLSQNKTHEEMLTTIHRAVNTFSPTGIIGFSMGGYLSIEYLLRQPVMPIPQLVLMSCSARGYTQKEIVQRQCMIKAVADGSINLASPRYLAPFLYDGNPNTQQHRDLLLTMTQECGNQTFVYQQTATCIRKNREQELRKIPVESLVMWGTEDRLVSEASVETLAAGLPKASLIKVPGAGHMLPIEKAVETAGHLEEFLAPSCSFSPKGP